MKLKSGLGAVGTHLHEEGTYPHFSSLNLPFIAITLIMAPFCLQKVQDVGEAKILAVLRGWWWDALRLSRLSLRLLLAERTLLLAALIGLGLRHLHGAKHGDLDCLWMENVGR